MQLLMDGTHPPFTGKHLDTHNESSRDSTTELHSSLNDDAKLLIERGPRSSLKVGLVYVKFERNSQRSVAFHTYSGTPHLVVETVFF